MSPRTILISGASRGIGAELAKLRHQRGDRLILLSRTKPQLPVGDRVQHCHVDLSDRAQLQRQIPAILKAHPQLDAVVSNAGDGRAIAHFEQLSPSQIQSGISTNLLSHMWLARLVWPHLRGQSKDRADLLFTGSEAALAGAEHGAVYCAAKFGLRGFAQSLRAAAVGSPVRVGIVHPGPVSSSFFDELDFQPSAGASLSPLSVAKQLSWLLDAPADTVVDEVVMSPRTRRFERKRR